MERGLAAIQALSSTFGLNFLTTQTLSMLIRVSAVADRPRDAGLCMLKSCQLLHETQLPQTECAMLHVTMNGRTCRHSKLSDKCMVAWSVDHLGVTSRSRSPTMVELYCQHLVVTELPWRSLGRRSCAINNNDRRPSLLIY